VKNGKVNLPFSIESRHKSYKLDFKVRDGLEYDVVLGKHWDGEMELDENDSRARINRNAKSKSPPFLSPPLYANLLICIQARDQDTVAVDSTCPVNLPPFSHFTAEAYHHLFTLSSQSPPRQPSPQTRLPPQHEPREEHLPPHTSYQMRRTSDDILPFEKRALTKENLCRLDSSEESVNGTDTFDNNGLELIESRTSVTNSKDNDSEDSEGGGVLLFKGRNTLRE
jgi:hypothetical protein